MYTDVLQLGLLAGVVVPVFYVPAPSLELGGFRQVVRPFAIRPKGW